MAFLKLKDRMVELRNIFDENEKRCMIQAQ